MTAIVEIGRTRSTETLIELGSLTSIRLTTSLVMLSGTRNYSVKPIARCADQTLVSTPITTTIYDPSMSVGSAVPVTSNGMSKTVRE